MAGILRATDRHGPERITSGKRVLPGVPITVHCYRIGATLLDAGSPNQVTALLDHLGQRAVHTVLLTHHHEDHIGLAGPLADRGARVLAPGETVPWLSDGISMPLYRLYTWGRPETVEAQALRDKVTTPEATFEVVHTPGHTPEHVAFFEPELGWLFSGDTYLGRRLELRRKEQLGPLLDSLEAMRALDADVLFPGHGAAVYDVDEALVDAVDHVDHLARRAQELSAKGASVGAIQRELLGHEGFMAYFTQGDFRKRHLVEQALALGS